MESAERILDYLRNTEFTEKELLGVYRRFLKNDRFAGFEEGCDFIRDILSRRRSYYQVTRSKKFKLILEELEDFINEKENN